MTISIHKTGRTRWCGECGAVVYRYAIENHVAWHLGLLQNPSVPGERTLTERYEASADGRMVVKR